MNGYVVSLVLAFAAGIFISSQSAINAQVGKSAGQYAMIVGVSLAQALVGGMILLRGGWGAFSSLTSPWMLAAGILGVFIMFSISTSIGAIGTLPVFVLVVLGQVIGSALIDHFGMLGADRYPITPQKIGSLLVIMAGVYFLIKSS